jgi:hypothetical protein
MHLPGLMDFAGIKEDALGQCRLPRVDVRGNPDVPRPFDRNIAFCHGSGGVHGDSWLVVASRHASSIEGKKIRAQKTPLAHFEEAAGRKLKAVV